MTYYIDANFHLHTEQGEGTTPVELKAFDGKCKEYIEGHLYVPENSTRTNEYGVEFQGETITPWKPYAELDAVQREYEKQKLSNCLEALQELGVEV